VPVPEEVLNQVANNCENAAFWLLMAVEGLRQNKLINISTLILYALARQLEIGDPDVTELPDVGCYTYRLVQAATNHGIVGRDRYNDTRDPTKPVSINMIEAGFAAKVTGAYQIIDTGGHKLEKINVLIDNDHAVMVAGEVDEAFENWGGGIYPGKIGPTTGGHAFTIIGRRQVGSNRQYLIRNSWGMQWGIKGNAWVDAEWIADGIEDVVAATAAPLVIL
jgi:hypothetical protein